MRYFKTIDGEYIVGLQTEYGQTEISEVEYNEILNVIRNKPTAPKGFDYHLKNDLTWELYELPVIDDEEATEEDYLQYLQELGVEV